MFKLRVRKLFLRLLVLVLAGAWPRFAFATELFETYISARAAGMGNAFSAVVDDKDALFYNPAALNRIHGFNLTILDPMVATDAQDAYSVAQKVSGTTDPTATLGNYFGRSLYVGAFASTGVWVHDFGAAAYDSVNVGFDLRNPAMPNANINATNDLGFAGGVAFGVIPDVFTIGFVGKRVIRYGLHTALGGDLLAQVQTTKLKNIFNAVGVGYGLDSGMLLTLPGPAKFTLSMVWKDMGQTKFIPLNDTYGTPPVQDNDFIAGFGADVDAFVCHIRPAMDFRHLNMYSEQLGKKIHAGMEIAFPFVSVRGGLYQGYPSYGVGLDFWWIHVDAATYGVELDTYPGQRESRRYTAQLTLQLNIDPDFKIFSGGASGVKPKQRR